MAGQLAMIFAFDHQIGVFHVMPKVQALFKTGLYIYTLTHEKWIQQSQVPILMILQQL